MRLRVLVLPEAESDVSKAIDWYDKRSEIAGSNLLVAVRSSLQFISENPLSSAMVYKNFRRKLLAHFPYAIYFRVETEAVIVAGLFHSSRNRRSIFKALRNRN